MKILPLILLIALLLPLSLQGQPPRAKKEFDDGVHMYLSKDYLNALKATERALRIYPEYAEAWILKADIHREMKDTTLAIDAYMESIRLDNDFFAGSYYSVGYLSFLSMDYDISLQYLEGYLSFEKIDAAQRRQAEFLLASARFAREAVRHPVPFNPILLPDSVNSEYDEFVNTLSLDGRDLYFTRLYASDARSTTGRRLQEDFFVSKLHNYGWGDAVMLDYPLNTTSDEGSLNISADGMYAFFAAHRPNDFGRYDIFASRRNGDTWGPVFNLGPVINGPSWDSQPCFSSDGRTLFFVSDRKGGLGSSDIWISRLQDDGSWSEPQNAGPEINTSRREMTPIIHPDNQTLYFSSEGHAGMGGMDMYVSRRQPDGSWGEAVNLGYPINQVNDEMNFVIHPDGQTAFFSRANPGRGMDIFQLDLPPVARPVAVTFLKGRISDKENGESLEAIFRLVDLDKGDTLIQALSDKQSGSFMIALPTNRNYALFAEKEGYYFHSENFNIDGNHPHDDPFLLNIQMEKMKAGATMVLRNVFFDVDKFDLKPESNLELNKFVALMVKNPKLKAEIGGHTDNTGSAEHNRELSLNRAKAVHDYLVMKGIAADRLSYKGYGMDKPVASNDNPEGRQLNRRTEIRFLD